MCVFARAGLAAAVVGPATDRNPVSQPAADQLITLNFPDNVELKSVVEYVSQRLSINILYDEQFGNQRATIRAPGGLTRDALLAGVGGVDARERLWTEQWMNER